MLKRLILILTLIITFTANTVEAASNFLNSVLLEKNEDGYNIVLRADNTAKVKKSSQSTDKITLTIDGITTSNSFNTMYKDTSDINNIIVENADSNTLKIYIQAPDIAKANIIFDTPNSAPIPVGDTFAREKITWSIISIALMFMVMRSAKNINTGNPLYDLHQKVVREREMEMYKNFKAELKHKPSINYTKNNRSYTTNVVRRNETIRDTLKNSKQLTRI
ncbi:MAG: hypothetical protein ACLSWI_06850 [Candidatus Gastranaerophilaceae bacterium]